VNGRGEVERILSSRPIPDGFPTSAILPDHSGYSISAVPSLICRALGIDDVAAARLEGIDVPNVDRIVFLIVDGFGYRSLERLRAEGSLPTIDALVERGQYLPLTSVFPSTTVAALATLATGLSPLEHGMIGYRLYLREVAGITNMIRFSLVGANHTASAIAAGLDPDKLLPEPTFYERLHERNVATHVLLPRAIAGSGLSAILYRGCTRVHPTSSIADMCVAAREILNDAHGKTLLTLYWPGLDSVAHVRGPRSDAYVAEARAVDAAIDRELCGRLDRTLLLITADHGFVPMSPADYVPLSDLDRLDEEALLPPVGEPRASYLYLRHGAAPMNDEPRLLRGGILRLTAERAVTSGLLGEGRAHPEIERRLGDLVLASTGAAGVIHPYPDAAVLRGMHGGLSEDEMLVPLIAAAL